MYFGNHTWDKRDAYNIVLNEKVVRPYNYTNSPGEGVRMFQKNNIKIAVLQLIGRINIRGNFLNPFLQADKAVEKISKKYSDAIILLDFHSEATSEAIAMGLYMDGKVTTVLNSHRHVQTADEQILKNGTAYITDLGMTGPKDSVLGMKKEVAFKRLIQHEKAPYILSETKQAILSGAVVEIDEKTKKAIKIKRIKYEDE